MQKVQVGRVTRLCFQELALCLYLPHQMISCLHWSIRVPWTQSLSVKVNPCGRLNGWSRTWTECIPDLGGILKVQNVGHKEAWNCLQLSPEDRKVLKNGDTVNMLFADAFAAKFFSLKPKAQESWVDVTKENTNCTTLKPNPSPVQHFGWIMISGVKLYSGVAPSFCNANWCITHCLNSIYARKVVRILMTASNNPQWTKHLK